MLAENSYLDSKSVLNNENVLGVQLLDMSINQPNCDIKLHIMMFYMLNIIMFSIFHSFLFVYFAKTVLDTTLYRTLKLPSSYLFI